MIFSKKANLKSIFPFPLGAFLVRIGAVVLEKKKNMFNCLCMMNNECRTGTHSQYLSMAHKDLSLVKGHKRQAKA